MRCRPTYEYGLDEIGRWRASNHIEFTGFPTPVRLTTNVPLTYVEDERPFLLERDRHLVLTWGEPSRRVSRRRRSASSSGPSTTGAGG